MTKKNWILIIVAIVLTFFCYFAARAEAANVNDTCTLKEHSNVILMQPDLSLSKGNSKNELRIILTQKTPQKMVDTLNNKTPLNWTGSFFSAIEDDNSGMLIIVHPKDLFNCSQIEVKSDEENPCDDPFYFGLECLHNK